MKVIVNKKEIEIFNGAKVADAIRLYYSLKTKKTPSEFPIVEDAFGNGLDADGRLSEGDRLFIKENEDEK